MQPLEGRGEIPEGPGNGHVRSDHNPDFFDDLDYRRKVSGNETASAALIYGGEPSFKRSRTVVYPWFAI